MSVPSILNRDRTMLLVIDVQTKLLPHIESREHVVAATAALIETAHVLTLPVMATVQYVKGLGPMHETLMELCSQQGVELLEKMAFSVCRDEHCHAQLSRMGKDQIIVAGIEGHVCVQQTVLDLLNMKLKPFVCADAVSSRRVGDLETGLARMQQAGAVITTTEAVLFELCEVSGTPEFKELLTVVKRFDEARLRAIRSETGVC